MNNNEEERKPEPLPGVKFVYVDTRAKFRASIERSWRRAEKQKSKQKERIEDDNHKKNS